MARGWFVLGAFFVAGVAWAEGEHGLVKDWDRNGDKKLSWQEVEPIGWSKELFELKDMNDDGFISSKDLSDNEKWMKAPVQNEKIVKAMDADGDGLVRRNEWWWDEPDFAKYDADKDGSLNAGELAKIPPAPAKPAPAKSPPMAPAKPKKTK